MLRFLFQLASHLHMTISQLLRNLTMEELNLWVAYSQIEPFECREIADGRNALLCTVVANVAGNKTKVADFLPEYGNETKSNKAYQVAKLMAAARGK